MRAWHADRRAGRDSAVFYTGSNERVDELNVRAQALRAQAGELGAGELALGHRPYGLRVGDEVLFRRRTWHEQLRRVENGTPARVLAVEPIARCSSSTTAAAPRGRARRSTRPSCGSDMCNIHGRDRGSPWSACTTCTTRWPTRARPMWRRRGRAASCQLYAAHDTLEPTVQLAERPKRRPRGDRSAAPRPTDATRATCATAGAAAVAAGVDRARAHPRAALAGAAAQDARRPAHRMAAAH